MFKMEGLKEEEEVVVNYNPALKYLRNFQSLLFKSSSIG